MVQSICVDFFSDRMGESSQVKSRRVHKIKGVGYPNNSQNWIPRFETNSKTPNTWMLEQKIYANIFKVWCWGVEEKLRGEKLENKKFGWKLMRKKFGGWKKFGEGKFWGPLGQLVDGCENNRKHFPLILMRNARWQFYIKFYNFTSICLCDKFSVFVFGTQNWCHSAPVITTLECSIEDNSLSGRVRLGAAV